MINPFDLTAGPFLAFYLAAALVTVIVHAIWLRRTESHKGPQALRLQDPYAIAYLRSGAREAIGVAVASLYDRRLVGQAEQTAGPPNEYTRLRATSTGRRRRMQPALERAIVNRLERPATLEELMSDPGLLSECKTFDDELSRRGLVAGAAARHRRWMIALVIAAPLLTIGTIRILISLSRGHTNLWFLVALMVCGLFAIGMVNRRRLTAAGRDALSDLRGLFRPLYRRRVALRPGDNPDDLLFFAAVFGLSSLPLAATPIAAMVPRHHASSSDGSSGDGGSSSSGGSSCGGGSSGCGGCGS